MPSRKRTKRRNKHKTKIPEGEPSSNVQLEGLELGSNGVTSWTRRGSTSVMLADQDVYAFLTKPANAFGACIAVPKNR